MHKRSICHVIYLFVCSFLKEIGANMFLSGEDLDSSWFCNQEFYSYAVNLALLDIIRSLEPKASE
jgi:hypothetical protein